TVAEVVPDPLLVGATTAGRALLGADTVPAWSSELPGGGPRRPPPPAAPPASRCRGTPWKSKGLTDGYAAMKARVIPALRRATDNGRLPVVVDAASCTEGLHKLLADDGLTVVDAVAFVDAHVLPVLPPGRRLVSIVVHPTCSST